MIVQFLVLLTVGRSHANGVVSYVWLQRADAGLSGVSNNLDCYIQWAVLKDKVR
jgi:hypothetical protein